MTETPFPEANSDLASFYENLLAEANTEKGPEWHAEMHRIIQTAKPSKLQDFFHDKSIIHEMATVAIREHARDCTECDEKTRHLAEFVSKETIKKYRPE